MANKAKIADTARADMAKRVRDEFKNKSLPAPANKNALKNHRTKWEKTLDDKLALIERREKTKYYDKNPDAYKKDWDDAYYARFILHISDDEWKDYLGG